jgi:hypothetical protein
MPSAELQRERHVTRRHLFTPAILLPILYSIFLTRIWAGKRCQKAEEGAVISIYCRGWYGTGTSSLLRLTFRNINPRSDPTTSKQLLVIVTLSCRH